MSDDVEIFFTFRRAGGRNYACRSALDDHRDGAPCVHCRPIADSASIDDVMSDAWLIATRRQHHDRMTAAEHAILTAIDVVDYQFAKAEIRNTRGVDNLIASLRLSLKQANDMLDQKLWSDGKTDCV